MAKGINKVILIGNIGADPEVRYMPSGDAMATLSLATSDTWKDKQTGEKQERTEWHRIVCFKQLGEFTGQYVKKGSKVYIEGSLRTRKWQDAQGQDRYTTEIVANELQLLDSKNSGGGQYQEQSFAPFQATSAQQAPTTKAAEKAGAVLSELDDDIPF